jgi:hypothetical protein
VEQTHSIPVHNGLEDFAVGDFVDGDAANGDFFVCGRHVEEFALVSAGYGPGNHQLVFFADGVVDGEMQIREGREEAVNLTPLGQGADGRTGDGGITERVTLGDYLLDHLEFVIVPYFLVKAAEYFFVSLSDGHE